jgi:hypothetical protein
MSLVSISLYNPVTGQTVECQRGAKEPEGQNLTPEMRACIAEHKARGFVQGLKPQRNSN